MNKKSSIYVGMMSGTSMDGVDAVAMEVTEEDFKFLGRAEKPYSDFLRGKLLDLCSSGSDEVHKIQYAGNEVAKVYAAVFKELLKTANIALTDVCAIGGHGQTIRHRPDIGSSTQIINGALLAELAECDVIVDFRSRDLAAGGQGAPLVPAFHEACFRGEVPRAIVNIGGISNITVLPPKNSDQDVIGFDCGPGNVLMDYWVGKCKNQRFDRNGQWARTGKVVDEFLVLLKSEPFLTLEPPKSTGRELFNSKWLERKIGEEQAQDIQASLLEYTAETISDAIDRFAPDTEEIYLCGGGSKNTFLLETIKRLNSNRVVETTKALGWDPQDVEAAAFAWLAYRFNKRMPGNLPEVTGARGPRILGALYPA